jgi:hypothetical protein
MLNYMIETDSNKLGAASHKQHQAGDDRIPRHYIDTAVGGSYRHCVGGARVSEAPVVSGHTNTQTRSHGFPQRNAKAEVKFVIDQLKQSGVENSCHESWYCLQLSLRHHC